MVSVLALLVVSVIRTLNGSSLLLWCYNPAICLTKRSSDIVYQNYNIYMVMFTMCTHCLKDLWYINEIWSTISLCSFSQEVLLNFQYGGLCHYLFARLQILSFGNPKYCNLFPGPVCRVTFFEGATAMNCIKLHHLSILQICGLQILNFVCMLPITDLNINNVRSWIPDVGTDSQH